MEPNLKRDEREIDGVRFMCEQHGAKRSLRLDARLGRLLGPGLADVLTGGGVADGDYAAMARGLVPLFANLSDDDAEALVDEVLVKTTAIDGDSVLDLCKKAHFEIVFGGRRMTLWKAVAFALEVNYRDFFEAAYAAFAKFKAQVAAKAAAAAPAPSPAI